MTIISRCAARSVVAKALLGRIVAQQNVNQGAETVERNTIANLHLTTVYVNTGENSHFGCQLKLVKTHIK